MDILDAIDPDDNFFSVCGDNQSQLTPYLSVDEFNSLLAPANDFTLLNLNIRSFNANGDKLLGLLCSLYRVPDVIVLTETWGNDDNVDQICLDGYDCYNTLRFGNGRGGGVSILARKQLRSNSVATLNRSTRDIESCSISCNVGCLEMVILGVYRPQGGSVMDFTIALNELLHDISVFNKSVIVTGDFNINMLSEECDAVNNYIITLQSLFYTSCISKPTRFPSNHAQNPPTLLDHTWINFYTGFQSGILLSDITDHCPTFIKLPNLCVNNKKIKLSFRVHIDENVQRFKRAISGANWHLDDGRDVHGKTAGFVDEINSLYRMCFPVKVKYVSEKRLNKPWLSTGILKSIKMKSHYFKMYKLGQINHSFLKKYNNRLTSVIRSAKKLYYRNSFNKYRQNLRSTWKLINSLMSRRSDKCSVRTLVVDGFETHNEMQIADSFNEYFSNVAINLESDIPHHDKSPTDYISANIPHSFFISPISQSECIGIISNLKNTSCKLNVVPVKILKLVSDLISEPLCELINLSVESGVFPDVLKMAEIVPSP